MEPASFIYVIGAATVRGYRTYVGWTLDPERRLKQHNGGIGAKSTRGLLWELLYVSSVRLITEQIQLVAKSDITGFVGQARKGP